MATVTSITVVNGGRDYSAVPHVEIVGGCGTGAQAHATVVNGAITAITVDVAGSGYSHVPTVEIRPGTKGKGSGGVGLAVIA